MIDQDVVMNENLTTDEMENMYLNFCLGNVLYSVEIRHVQQILAMTDISSMPEMSYYTKGFINLRGNIIPVISMRLRFNMPEIEYDERACIIVIEIGCATMGLLVDSIRETLTITPEDIAPPPHVDEAQQNRYIRGIGKLEDRKVSVILDLEKLFGGNEL